jgi:hypothetical protein
MTMILRIATVVPAFRDIVLPNIESAIFLGKRNLKRFSVSIAEFEAHLDVLEQLDGARRSMDMG